MMNFEPDEYSLPSSPEMSRKRFLQRAGAAGIGAALGAGFSDGSAMAQGAPLAARESVLARPEDALMLNVKNFGARGDGKTDDTRAFQAAIDAVSTRGGIVSVPEGQFLIASHLDLKDDVTLEGTHRAPHIGGGGELNTKFAGSVLLAVEDAGGFGGTPFITIRTNSTLKGLTIYYPEQPPKVPFKPYPWTVRGIGANCAIVDVFMANPYAAVDFGTQSAHRHYINGLYAQPLYRGVLVDKCGDVGRLMNVHFWPFWWNGPNQWPNGPLHEWTRQNMVAFTFGKTDWEYVFNCFCISCKIGYHFLDLGSGPGNAMILQSGSDVGPLSVQLDAVQDHAGVSFVNGQFMSHVKVMPTNSGPVKFTNCGFFGGGDAAPTKYHATLDGDGQTSFQNCQFQHYDEKSSEAAAIRAQSGAVSVIGCEFMDTGKNQIQLDAEVESAIIVGNRFRGEEKIVNKSRGDVQIGLNSSFKPAPPARLKTRFFTGFEPHQPQPRTDDLLMNNALPEYSLIVKTDAGRNGGAAAVISGTHPSAAHAFVYLRAFTGNISVTDQTVLRYWVKPENDLGRFSHLDLLFSDGSALRDSFQARDQNKRSLHPSMPRGPVGQWTRIETQIGKWFAGKTISAIILAHDSAIAAGKFQTAFDDIEIGEPMK